MSIRVQVPTPTPTLRLTLTLGEKMLVVRKRLRVEQAQLARILGTHYKAINWIENGRTKGNLSSRNVARISGRFYMWASRQLGQEADSDIS